MDPTSLSDDAEVWVVDAVQRSPHGHVIIDAHVRGMPVRKRFEFDGPADDPLPYRPGQTFRTIDLPPLTGEPEQRRG